MSSVLDAVSKYAGISPDTTAIRTANSSLSYSELYKKVNKLASQLANKNIRLLALYADNCPSWVIVDLACQQAKICLIPIPTFFSEQQIAHTLKSSSADALIAPIAIADNAIEIPLNTVIGNNLKLFKLPVEALANLPENTSKITFTSGSTGNPKGVCLSIEQMVNVAKSIVEVSPSEKITKHLCILPLAVLLENIGGVYANLLIGSTIILLPANEVGFIGSSLFNADELLSTLSRYKPNSLILLPQLLASVLQSIGQNENDVDITSLAFVAVGGGKVVSSYLKQAQLYGLPIYEGYGLSECSSVVCLNTPQQQRIGTVGKYLSHIDAEIAADGELIINGQTFLGYLNNPDSWYPKMLATGDLVEKDDDGYISIYGRKKNLLISSFGRNISPEWVESTLQQAPSILQCVVFGDAQPFCIALIYTSEQVTNEQIEQELYEYNQELPDYAQVKHWHVLQTALTFEDGFVTVNGRLKRDEIALAFNEEINKLYQ